MGTFTFTVTEDATYQVLFMKLWKGNLVGGKTYNVSLSGSGGIDVSDGSTTTNYEAIGGLTLDGGNVTINLNNGDKQIITFAGEIQVKQGHLTINKTKNVTGSTLKRHPFYMNRLFMIRNKNNTAPNNCRLTLNGYASGGTVSNLSINGGDDGYGIEGPNESGDYTPNHAHNTGEANKTKAKRPIMLVDGAQVNINRVSFVNTWDEDSDGGAIYITNTSADSKAKNVVNIQNSSFQRCLSISSGAAIRIATRETVTNDSGTTYNLGLSEITVNSCEFISCFAVANVGGSDVGGVIGTASNSICALSITNCTFEKNYTNKLGCIAWNSVPTAGGEGSLEITNCTLFDNWSKGNGGMLNVGASATAPVTIKDCTIYNNKAKGNGGAIYIGASGTLNIEGTTSIYDNKVLTAGRHGGGIYQGGTFNIGATSATSLQVTGNTSESAKATVADNIYLPDTKTIAVGANATATGINIGVYTENAASVGTDIPVLTGSASKLTDVYDALLGAARLTDDRNVPQRPKYTSADPGTIYFALTNYDFGPYDKPYAGPISNADSLYKFMCWVNGVNGFGSTHASAVGNVTADIDMSGIDYWIPIGESASYTGTFNGNGHVISGLNITDELYSNYGLFGTTAGATIDGVFVTDCAFAKNTVGAIGCIVGRMQGGTLSNSTCSGTLTATHASCVAGGLVGKLEKNIDAAATIHSSYAGTDQTGYQMGGLVGDLAADCNLYNSFANPQFTYSGSGTEYVGGLVGVNSGTVENCYSRVRGSVPGTAYFGWLAGDNTSGTLTSSYIPVAYSNYTATSKTGTQNSLNTYTPVVAPYLYNHSNDNMVGSSTETLCNELNDWVAINNETPGQPACALWKRTTAGGTAYSATAGDINGDYPIHEYSGYTCVASADGITLDYAASLDAMLTRHTSDATINLYANDETSLATGDNEVVYIDENVSLLQTDDTKDIEAYTCQTLETGTESRWHFISSSLSNSGIGFNYGTASQVPFSWSENPCSVTFSTTDDEALFPHDVPNINKVDLYAFYEPEYHWINLKRNSASHWHMNATTTPINYHNGVSAGNETILIPGKGYLASIDQEQLLQNRGTLNNGDVSVTLNYSAHQAWAGLVGYNLIGNPYQSYLGFSTLASKNMSLWAEKGCEPTYAVYDAEMGGYIQYKEGASRGAKAADGIINMHQGFMVRVASATNVTFTNDMRINAGTTTGIRGEQPAYPLINFTVTDSEGVNDFAVLELGRDADAGAEKLRANDSKGWLYLHHGSEDYGILFRTEVEDYQPLWFEAEEAGTYTLSWETANAEFESLTLVDNITGVTTDMLSNDSYTFEATPEQYASRFKIVIGDYKDIDENEVPEPVEGPTFAYYANGEIHLVETQNFASLQVIDMTGRVILSRDAARHVSTTGMAPGVYLLRLTTIKGTKIQKMVIE